MRPDFINETNTPALTSLARQGVTFSHHHSTYVSATEVNGTAIATGCYPGHSGLIGNTEYRPRIDALKPTHTEVLASVRKGDEVSGGRYLRVPTLPEILRQNGGRTAVAGAKPVALLPDRAIRSSPDQGINVFAGSVLPPALLETVVNAQGGFPRDETHGQTRNDWTTKVLIQPLWADAVPEFSLLWLNQPDAAQHAFAPGSRESLAAIRNSDDNLARVLAALDAKGARSNTDVLVLSDHGCSTVSARADVSDALTAAGFDAVREFDHKPRPGEILVVSNGGSCMVYVIGHQETVIQKILQFFQQLPFTGVLFTRDGSSGTFRLSQVHLDSDDAPDILISFRWTSDKNKNGTPGMLATDRSTYSVGQGHHGSLSPFDMHNILIAAGPGFRAGAINELPSGNVDIAPTVLWLLGKKPSSPMDGRVLSEALTTPGPSIKLNQAVSSTNFIAEAVVQTSGGKETLIWRQHLNCVRVNGVDYFDEGNGSQSQTP